MGSATVLISMKTQKTPKKVTNAKNTVSFRSEAFAEIPLPPEVSFEQAFARLDPGTNSFYLLELDQESYMQCGGSQSACALEVRKADADGVYRSYVIGRNPSESTPFQVKMSNGGVWVQRGEVLTVDDAALLFEGFFTGQPLPAKYTLRDRLLDPVQQPADQVDPQEPGDKAADVVSDGDDDERVVRWLAARDPSNRFGIEGYDCSEYVRSLFSTAMNPDIARSFLNGRSSSGDEYHGKYPEKAVAVDCDLRYELTEPVDGGTVFRAVAMEDKWDIFLKDGRLIFCRSWTGSLEMLAEVDLTPSSLAVTRVWASPEFGNDDPNLSVRQVDFLIRSHILGRAAPHPLPLHLPRNAQHVGNYSYGHFGRNCVFGSFEDTTLVPDLELLGRTQ